MQTVSVGTAHAMSLLGGGGPGSGLVGGASEPGRKQKKKTGKEESYYLIKALHKIPNGQTRPRVKKKQAKGRKSLGPGGTEKIDLENTKGGIKIERGQRVRNATEGS